MRQRPVGRGLRRSLLLAAMLASCRSSTPARGEPGVPGAHGVRPTAVVDPPAPAHPPPPVDPDHRAHDVTITVLSTTEAEVGEGEWGFCALVDVDGESILFDTGAKPQTVRRNARALGIDLTRVPRVVLSHHHDDHVGGLLSLRRAVAERAPDALATVHVARGMFAPRRYGNKTHEVNDMIAIRPAFERTGGRFVVHDEPAPIAPGVWVTGPVPRMHPEHNWSALRRIRTGTGNDGWDDDDLPESQALVIDSDEGLIVISGCGHAGIVNIVTHAQARIRSAPVRAAVGGFHLFRARDEHLRWTAQALEQRGLASFYGAHCTGAAAVRTLRKVVGEGTSREVAVGWRLRLPEPPRPEP